MLELLKVFYELLKKTLSQEELDLINKELFTKHVHGTTHIEGNVVQYNDIIKILELEKTPPNYSINDVKEIDNYSLLTDFYKNKKKYSIDEKLILKIHSLLMNGLTTTSLSGKKEKIPVGKYRKANAYLKGVFFQVSAPEMIKPRMGYLLKEYHEKRKTNIHPIENISIFHQKFEEIHPFADGNGRTGREILNIMLKQRGFPPIYLRKGDEKKYYDALEAGNQENYVLLIDLIIFRICSTIVFYLSKTSLYDFFVSDISKTLIPEEQIRKDFIALLKQCRNTLVHI